MERGAIILCGGKSTRMGRDKATLPFGPESMLQRVVRLLSQVVPVNRIVVVAAEKQKLPELPTGIITTRDEHPARGPLEGLAAGLRAVPDGIDAVYVTSCDVPLLASGFVRKMFELLEEPPLSGPLPRSGGEGTENYPFSPALGEKVAEGRMRGLSDSSPPLPGPLPRSGGEGTKRFEIAVPRDGDHHHPLAAVYRRTVLPHVERLLVADRLRPRFLFEEVATREVSVEELRSVDPQLDTLKNLNTPEDYEAALRTAGIET